MLEADKVNSMLNKPLPHWKQNGASSSLAWSPPTGKGLGMFCCLGLLQVEEQSKPLSLLMLCKASMCNPRGTKLSPLSLHPLCNTIHMSLLNYI